METALFNSYFLVFAGTILVGLLMAAVIVIPFVAVMSVVGVLYGVVHALRRLTEWAFRSRPMVSPEPIVLRHSSRAVLLARQKTTRPATAGTRQLRDSKAA